MDNKGNSPAQRPRSGFAFAQRPLQPGQDLEQVANQTIVGNLKDRRLGILVDRDDQARILHAGDVLDRSREADRDIEFGRDDLAGLADLAVVGHIAGVDGGAGRADRGAQPVGERVEKAMESLGAAQPPPARDDDSGAAELGPVSGAELAADQAREAQIAAGIPRAQVYDFTMYILCGMLVVGLIANALVRPLDKKWFMSNEEVASLQAKARSADASITHGSFGIGKGGLDLPAAIAWAVVGVPILWGVWITLEKTAALFKG